MTKLQKLRDQKQTLHTELVALKDSLPEGGTFDENQLKKWDDISLQVGTIDNEIKTLERLASLDAKDNPDQRERRFGLSLGNVPKVDHAAAVRAWALGQLNRREFVTAEMQSAFDASGLRMDEPIAANVQWNQTRGTLTEGGNAVNDAVVAGVVKAMKDYGGMMEACRVFSTTDGAPLKKVLRDSTAFKALKTAELGTIANTTQTTNKATFGAMELTSGIYETSLTLVRDAAYNMLGDMQDAIGESFGRGANTYLTTSTAGDEPQGIEPALTAVTPGVLSYGLMLSLFHSVNAAYRRSPKCAWMMSDASLLNIKTLLLDADGRPLWKVEPNAVGGFDYVIEGKRVVINDDMTTNTIAFGDFNRYEIRLVGGIAIRTLYELFALKNAVGMIGHTAIDGRIVDASAMRKLVFTLS